MFTEESFQLPLEVDLKLKIMTDEVKSCTCVETLQNSLIEVTKLMTRYQHMLNVTLQAALTKELEALFEEGRD